MTNLIELENVSKKFSQSLRRSMLYGAQDLTRSMMGIDYDTGKLRKGEFWSLNDVSLNVKEGDSIGVVGRNGSGKTTLLRMINGIFPPDKGKLTIRGKIGALIAVGAGFHPHMTGRENIYLNGTILGMTRTEIDKKFEEIIDFADIGEFIDSPVSTYSSGMTVRLGFAIAINSSPDILLADEILAVGDLPFALKCYRKISEYRERGGTIVLVSHNIQVIRNSCNEVMWLDKGSVRAFGPSGQVCDQFEQEMLEVASDQSGDGIVIHNDPAVQITAAEFLNSSDQPASSFEQGDDFKLRIRYKTTRVVEKPVFTVSITNPENIQIISNYTKFDNYPIEKILGEGYIDFMISSIQLKPSTYTVSLTLTEKNDVSNNLEWHDRAYRFAVRSIGHTSYGLINPKPKWNLVTN